MTRWTTSVSLATGLLASLLLASPALAAPPDAPATRPAAEQPSPAGDIIAIDPTMSLWWIDPTSRYRVENGELIVHNPTAKAGAFAGFIGGPSWENHHVALEFMVERDTSLQQPRPGAFPFNIQIAPHDMSMFFQLMGQACNICVNTPEVNGGQFTHVSDKPAPPVVPNRWYRLEVISQDRQITMLLDGKVINDAQIPASTRGMLGLLVNFAADAIVHIRSMQVTLLDPDPQQLAESQRNAKENWERNCAQLKRAGKPLPKAPW